MLKSLSNNLNMLMARDRLNSNELARKISIPATTIKRIRNNEQANPTITTLLPIAQFFSISLNQLIGNEALLSSNEICSKERLHKIPLLSWHECMDHAFLDLKKYHRQVSTERNVSAKAFALKIEDHDLEFFHKDSILIIDPEKKPETSDFVVVGNVEQNSVAIRKYIIEIDNIYLKPLVVGVGVSTLSSNHKILGVIIQYKVNLKI